MHVHYDLSIISYTSTATILTHILSHTVHCMQLWQGEIVPYTQIFSSDRGIKLRGDFFPWTKDHMLIKIHTAKISRG